MCQDIVSEVAPNIGILDSDIDMVMRVGGETIKAEISVEDIPKALSSVLAIKSENEYFHELFLKYDSDSSGYLPKSQLKGLITEINDGNEPTSSDLDYVIRHFDDFHDTVDGMIKEDEIRAAIIEWYFKSEENKQINSIRNNAKLQQQKYISLILQMFEHSSNNNIITRNEVRNLCQVIAKEVAPNIDVLESDIDTVMRLDGFNIKSEITIEELPKALSSVLTLKSEYDYFHSIFQKYDINNDGYINSSQLKSIIKDINNDIEPNDEDIRYVMCQFNQCNSQDGKINENDLKTAIMKWYLHTEDYNSLIPFNMSIDDNNGHIKHIVNYKQLVQRHHVRSKQMNFSNQILLKFDHTKTGTLNREEVRNMCQDIVSEVAPNIGILDSDIDMVMRVGGETIKAEISVEDIPKALSSVLAIKSENEYFHELFLKYDSDSSGYLPKSQLKGLITEINDGNEPTSSDLDYVLNKFDHLGSIFDNGVIHEDLIRAAIIGWYFKTEGVESPVPKTLMQKTQK